MGRYKFSYNIEKVANNEAFKLACQKIEASNIEGLQKKNLLIDVDGSLIQLYVSPEGEIKLINDYEVDAVYADSDIDLSALFASTPEILL